MRDRDKHSSLLLMVVNLSKISFIEAGSVAIITRKPGANLINILHMSFMSKPNKLVRFENTDDSMDAMYTKAVSYPGKMLVKSTADQSYKEFF
jgi:hypothetical protein